MTKLFIEACLGNLQLQKVRESFLNHNNPSRLSIGLIKLTRTNLAENTLTNYHCCILSFSYFEGIVLHRIIDDQLIIDHYAK